MIEKLFPLKFPPGIYRNGTRYESKGRWYNSNLVRFYEGAIRPVQGWRVAFDADNNPMPALVGIPRAAIAWRSAAGEVQIAVGTSERLYVIKDGTAYDITPSDFTAGAGSASSGAGNGDYGSGLYGSGLYGIGRAPLAAQLSDADTWQLDAFGDTLVACCTNGGRIYVWTGDTAALAEVADFSPEPCRGVVIAPERFVLALGADNNVRRVQWASQGSTTDWTASDVNTAGDFDLTTNGRIMCGRRTKAQTLIWTDTDLHSATYIGGEFIYSFKQEGDACGIVSPQAVAIIDSTAIWMGRDSFYGYDGFVKPIPCSVHDHVFDDFNAQQASKVFATTVSEFGEVWFFYPSAGSAENDRYAVFNYRENHWTIGTLSRTAALDRGAMPNPVMFDALGTVYTHEVAGGTRTVPLDTLLADALDDTDAVLLQAHTPDSPTAFSWDKISGDDLEFAADALLTTGLNAGFYVADEDPGLSDYEASITLRRWCALGVRMSGTDPEGYYFGVNAAGTHFRLFGLDSAGAPLFTEQTLAIPSGLIGADILIALRVSGAVITGFANGLQMLTQTDATLTGGKVGLAIEAQSAGRATTVLDACTDVNGTALGSHVPSVGGTWAGSFTPGLMEIQSNKIEVVASHVSTQLPRMTAARTFALGDDIFCDVLLPSGAMAALKFQARAADATGFCLRVTRLDASTVRFVVQETAAGFSNVDLPVDVAWPVASERRIGVTLSDVSGVPTFDMWWEPAGGGARTTVQAGITDPGISNFTLSHDNVALVFEGVVDGQTIDNISHTTDDAGGGNLIARGPFTVKGNATTHDLEVAEGDAVLNAAGELVLIPFLESGPIELGDGDHTYKVQRVVPDEKNLGDVQARFFTALFPTETEVERGPFSLANPTSVRFTARQVRMRLEEVHEVNWRIGVTRLGLIEGGRR